MVATRIVYISVLLLLCANGPTWAQTTPIYQLTKSVLLGAPDRWDAVALDQEADRVYVAHGDRVTVVDGVNGKIIGEVGPYINGIVHGIAVSHAAKRGYTDDGKAGTANSFDLASLKVRNAIKADVDADGIVADPVSGHVFVINSDPGTITVLDPKADKAIAKIDVGAKLEFGIGGNNGKLYVNGEEKKEIVRIDTRTNKVDAHWSMPDCVSPHGIAFDEAARRVISTCANGVMTIINAENGSVVTKVAIGHGTDGAAFDPIRKLAFSSNGLDGTLSVVAEIDPNTFVPVATIKTAVTGRTMAINPKTGRAYIAAGDVDSSAPGRPKALPGTLKLLFFDPQP